MKRLLARAYWLAGIAISALFMLTAVGLVLYGVLFAFREIIPSMVAELLITAFLLCCIHLWNWCDSYLKSSKGDKDS